MASHVARYKEITDILIGLRGSLREALDTQFLCLAEETGEASQAWRRHTGRARRDADTDTVLEELADVIITAYVTADMVLRADPEYVHMFATINDYITEKLIIIDHRGGV